MAVTASTKPLCHEADVTEGDAKGFPIDGNPRRKVIVLREGGRLIGWMDACPHYPGGTPMAWRTNAYLNKDGTKLVCASHGATFDKETGDCELGPCIGQSLTPVPLRVDADGGVHIADPDQGEKTNGK
jgi:nitrite reductase/ring-hydroxylating ferredoxin subunit